MGLVVVAAVWACGVGGCWPADRPSPRMVEGMKKMDAMTAAGRYLAKEHADWWVEVKTMPGVVHDRKEVSEVTWELPEGMRVRRGYHG
jgi:hypothetical protein